MKKRMLLLPLMGMALVLSSCGNVNEKKDSPLSDKMEVAGYAKTKELDPTDLSTNKMLAEAELAAKKMMAEAELASKKMMNGVGATQMMNGYTGDEESASADRDYRAACSRGDFETAHAILGDLLETYNSSFMRNDDYYTAFSYIYPREIQYILANLEGDECVDKIIFLLTEIPITGMKPAEGDIDDGGSFGLAGDISNHSGPGWRYLEYVKNYNALCDNILTLAINRRNQRLAKMVLLQYVENVSVVEKEIEDPDRNGNFTRVTYSYTDLDRAKKKYNNALQLGAFED